MPKNLKQKVTLNAKPHEVFELLLDETQHAAFTRAPATIDRSVGGQFSCYGGQLTGRIVEQVKDKLLVQAWRAKSWNKGVWSIATYELAKAPGGKTTLTFTQTGIPDASLKNITQGWKVHYWEAMKAYLAP